MLVWSPDISVIDWSTVESGSRNAGCALSYLNERIEVRVPESSIRAEETPAAVDPNGLDGDDEELKTYGNACEDKSKRSALASGREHCEYGRCQTDRAAYDRQQARN